MVSDVTQKRTFAPKLPRPKQPSNSTLHAAELAPDMVRATARLRPDDGAQLLVDEPKSDERT